MLGLDALLFGCGYGVFMGTYPVPIKAPEVLAANVHPLVFQGWKSFWVFVTGLCFLVPVVARGESPVFTWWGVACAVVWVPGGSCTIFAVPRIGMSLAIVIACATAAIQSFLVAWFFMGENVKQYQLGGHRYYLAPVYLFACVLGMVALIYAPRLSVRRSASELELSSLLEESGKDSDDEMPHGAVPPTTSGAPAPAAAQFALGVAAALVAGTLATVQLALVNLGREHEMARAGCAGSLAACPASLQQAFDPAGSWSASFGVGAAVVTAVFLGGLAVLNSRTGHPPPHPHFEVMKRPGSLAGLCWSLANFLGTCAVAKGGNAVVVAQMTSVQLITSGVWGIFYYHELDGRGAVVWAVSAAWTLIAIVLLGREKL